MGTAAVIGAIGLGLSAAQAGYGIYQSEKAKREADKLEQPEITNPYAGLDISTIGGRYQGVQALRSQATQTEALARAGGRGLAYINPVAQTTAEVNQRIAANYDAQRKQLDQMYAQGEQYKNQMEVNQYNQEMAGYGQMYGSGQQNMFSGIQSAGGILASGLAEGGAFNPDSKTDDTSGGVVTFGDNNNKTNYQEYFSNQLNSPVFNYQPLIKND
jgi:hypothetical protein